MSEAAAAVDTHHAEGFHDELEPSLTPGNTGKLGMWVFLAGDAMTFGAGIAAYGALRWYNVNWPNPAEHLGITLTAIMTFILICSSLTMVESLSGVEHGDMRKMRIFLALTVLGGLTFLGCQAFEWNKLINHEGLTIKNSLFEATFFILTGFHGMHVSGGVIYLSTVLFGSFGKEASHHETKMVEVAGLYWHFVDLVWILIFTFVYLI
jgi:cytochrome c oxidase subunit III